MLLPYSTSAVSIVLSAQRILNLRKRTFFYVFIKKPE